MFLFCRISVPPRAQSRKVTCKGMFVGAKVTRGAVWCYGDQDGMDAVTTDIVVVRCSINNA